MALVLKDLARNLYVYIYSNDHEPSHVHVFVGRKRTRGQANIKINLGSDDVMPEVVASPPGIEEKIKKQVLLLIVENQDMLLEKWRQIHGGKKEMDGGTN